MLNDYFFQISTTCKHFLIPFKCVEQTLTILFSFRSKLQSRFNLKTTHLMPFYYAKFHYPSFQNHFRNHYRQVCNFMPKRYTSFIIVARTEYRYGKIRSKCKIKNITLIFIITRNNCFFLKYISGNFYIELAIYYCRKVAFNLYISFLMSPLKNANVSLNAHHGEQLFNLHYGTFVPRQCGFKRFHTKANKQIKNRYFTININKTIYQLKYITSFISIVYNLTLQNVTHIFKIIKILKM